MLFHPFLWLAALLHRHPTLELIPRNLNFLSHCRLVQNFDGHFLYAAIVRMTPLATTHLVHGKPEGVIAVDCLNTRRMLDSLCVPE